MNECRRISKKICQSGRFLRMPQTSQNLYFHLLLAADDAGVAEAYTVMEITKSATEDLDWLLSREFITMLNEEYLIVYINDWLIHNPNLADCEPDSIYLPLLLKVCPEVKYQDVY